MAVPPDLASLATKLDVDIGGLEQSTARYNAAVRNRAPDPFGRQYRPGPISTPPFYGVRTTGGMLLTRGGPRVDTDLRPVGRDGKAVKGLRLAGEILGMSQFSGDAFAGGMSIGPALSLGRWAALRAAEAAGVLSTNANFPPGGTALHRKERTPSLSIRPEGASWPATTY